MTTTKTRRTARWDPDLQAFRVRSATNPAQQWRVRAFDTPAGLRLKCDCPAGQRRAGRAVPCVHAEIAARSLARRDRRRRGAILDHVITGGEA